LGWVYFPFVRGFWKFYWDDVFQGNFDVLEFGGMYRLNTGTVTSWSRMEYDDGIHVFPLLVF
jgi:hypothetical protein